MPCETISSLIVHRYAYHTYIQQRNTSVGVLFRFDQTEFFMPCNNNNLI